MKKHLKSKENWVYGIQLSRCGSREGEYEKFGNLDLSTCTSMPLILGKHGDFKFFVFISDLISTLQLLKWMKLSLLCSFVLTICDFVVYEDMVWCVNILESWWYWVSVVGWDFDWHNFFNPFFFGTLHISHQMLLNYTKVAFGGVWSFHQVLTTIH